MIKKLFFLTLGVVVGLLFFFPGKTFAAESLQSFLYTEAFASPPPPRVAVGTVYFYKTIPLNYISGRVYISEKADGTGTIQIGEGDQLQLTFSGPYGNTRYIFNYIAQPKTTQHQISTLDITHYVSYGMNNIQLRLLDWAGKPKSVSSIYLVYQGKTIGTEQFLDLPWDYASKGMNFTQAALAIGSFFDHEYPLLSSGGLTEPRENIVTFRGERSTKPYTSHDGYDYNSLAKVSMGDAVLAAAAGTAEYVTSCGACGNMITIDHHNGYQTRYMHLQKDGLIIATPHTPVEVMNRQIIGKVGATGNVIPADDRGAHIHFTVIKDKNNNGTFEDNIPDGITDPYGWQSKTPDPWENYQFNYYNTPKTGNKSSYLWKNDLPETVKTITPLGATVQVEDYTIVLPNNAVDNTYALETQFVPFTASTSAEFIPITTSLKVKLRDVFDKIFRLLQPATISIQLNEKNLSQVDTNNLFVYSQLPSGSLQKESIQNFDPIVKKITFSTSDLNREFIVLAKKLDSQAPLTTYSIQKFNTQQGHLIFDITDNVDGSGVESTLYKLENNEWEIYDAQNPPIIELAQTYRLAFYSQDKAGNLEEIQTMTIQPSPNQSTPSPVITATITLSPQPTLPICIVPTISTQPSITPFPTSLPIFTPTPSLEISIRPTILPSFTPSPFPTIGENVIRKQLQIIHAIQKIYNFKTLDLIYRFISRFIVMR